MANVTRNVNFRFTPTGFVVECAPSQTPEHASSRTTSRRKVTQAKVGVISISPQSQESDGNWTVVLSRKTKAKNLKSRRANSSEPRTERPITCNAAKKNSEIAPPTIYPEQVVSQLAMRDFPTLITSSGKWTKDQKGKAIVKDSPMLVSPRENSPMLVSPQSISSAGSMQELDNTPPSRSSPATASSKSKESTVHMAEMNQENLPSTEDHISEIAEAQRILRDECRNLSETLATLAHNVAQIAAPPATGAINRHESCPEHSHPQGAGSRGSVPVARTVTQDDVRQVVEEAVRLEKERANTGRFRYWTPYPREIEDVPFPTDFKLPDFQKFKGNGSPEEHLLHFIISMGNLSTTSQYCLRLFGSSLTGKAFRWYSGLMPESIRTWEQMQDAFISNFFSSERDVSIAELASVRQRENEPVEKFIDRWKTLGVSCRQLLEEEEQVNMCLNSMEPRIAFGLISADIKTFRDLATKAHALEVMATKMSIFQIKTEKKEANRLMVNTVNQEKKKNICYNKQETKRRKDSDQCKEQVNGKRPRPYDSYKEYAFGKEDMLPMMETLLAAGTISLPSPKYPEEVEMTKEEKYCHYHRCLRHRTEDCFTLKNIIKRLIKQGEIVMNRNEGQDKKVAVNMTSVRDPTKNWKDKGKAVAKREWPAVINSLRNSRDNSEFVELSSKEVSYGLASIRQREDELVREFINRWRIQGASRLRLVKEEKEQVKLCMECMKLSIALSLTNSNIQTFQDLIEEACSLEKIHAKVSDFYISQLVSNLGRNLIDMTQEEREAKNESGSSDTRNMTEHTIKKMKKEFVQPRDRKKYSFVEDDMLPMLNKLLVAEKIRLPRLKRPRGMKKIGEGDYCHYHRYLGHRTENCFGLKTKLQKMIDKGDIFIRKVYEIKEVHGPNQLKDWKQCQS